MFRFDDGPRLRWLEDLILSDLDTRDSDFTVTLQDTCIDQIISNEQLKAWRKHSRYVKNLITRSSCSERISRISRLQVGVRSSYLNSAERASRTVDILKVN